MLGGLKWPKLWSFFHNNSDVATDVTTKLEKLMVDRVLRISDRISILVGGLEQSDFHIFQGGRLNHQFLFCLI